MDDINNEVIDTLSAIVLYSYNKSADDELTIAKGDIVMVLEEYDDGWWLIGTDRDEVGIVPSNYLQPIDNDKIYPEVEHPVSSSDLYTEEVASVQQKLPMRTDSIKNRNEPLNRPSSKKKNPNTDASILPHVKGASSSDGSGNGNQLDQVSLDRLTEEITKRLNQELTLRDRKLIDHVKEMINQSTSPLLGQLGEDVVMKPQHHSLTEKLDDGNQIFPSKIPVRVALPRLVDPISAVPGTESNHQQFSNAPKRRLSQHESKLPVLLNRNLMAQRANNERNGHIDGKDEVNGPSGDGIHYAQCRSVVFPPTPSVIQIAPNPVPGAALSLKHIYGYDGDFNRHGSSIKGKNVHWVHDQRVIYPAAALVVIQSAIDCRQGFFCGHSDDVTSLAVHPSKTIAASGQLGKDSLIFVWDITSIGRGESLSKTISKLKPIESARGISGISFSGDGKFITATGIDESHSLMVFDWKEGTMVASAKIGHVDVNQVFFNPYLYCPLDVPPKSSMAGDASASGSYCIVSFGSKQIKFWVLKVKCRADGNVLEDISSFKGRKLNQKKGAGVSIRYTLEGNIGALPNKAATMPEITSFFVTNDSISSFNDNIIPTSRVFFGTVDGSVYIWQQLQDVATASSSSVGWLPRGSLLSVVTDLHDTVIADMHCITASIIDEEGQEFFMEKVLSASIDGIINVWHLNHDPSSNKSIPLEHLDSLSLENDYARSISWNTGGNSAVLGTVGNSVMLLNYEDQNSPIDDQEMEDRPTVTLKVLNQSHDGKVRKLAVNPIFTALLASVSSDKTVRLWATNKLCQCSCLSLPSFATSIEFSSNGKYLTIGNEKGEINIFESEEFNRLVDDAADSDIIERAIDAEALKTARWKLKVRKQLGAKSDQNSVGKKAYKKCEIVEIKYSPSGDVMAAGCKDNLIHILSVSGGYKHVAVCRGHSSWIKNIDFSADGSAIQSTDAARELLYWDAFTGQRITNAAVFRDLEWKSISCVYGWGVMGVFNGSDGLPSAEGDINCVSRSADGLWLVAGGSFTPHNAIKLFNYPCLNNAIPSYHGGHTSPVLDVTFLVHSDNSLEVATAGGNDCCLFQWQLSET